jgi:small ligand-binding sensory domain FIST
VDLRCEKRGQCGCEIHDRHQLARHRSLINGLSEVHQWLASKGIEVGPRPVGVRRTDNQVSAELEAITGDLLARRWTKIAIARVLPVQIGELSFVLHGRQHEVRPSGLAFGPLSAQTRRRQNAKSEGPPRAEGATLHANEP